MCPLFYIRCLLQFVGPTFFAGSKEDPNERIGTSGQRV